MSEAEVKSDVKERVAALRKKTKERTEAKKAAAPDPEPELKRELKAGNPKKDLLYSGLWNTKAPKAMPDFAVVGGVYEPDEFAEEVRGFIPEDEAEYVAAPMQTAMYTLAMNNNQRCLIFGPKGSGKSTMPKVHAARTRQPFFRIPCRRDM